MFRNALSTLLVLVAVAPASAELVGPATSSPPTLKREVTVTSDVVRIGDLIDNAGYAATTPIFRAPDLGQTGAVPTSKVIDAALAHGLTVVDTQGIAEIMVTRASRAITVKDLEARIALALTSRYGIGAAKNLSVRFDRDARTIQLEPRATGDLQVSRMAYDPASRRFDITLELPDGASARGTLVRYTGMAFEAVEVAVPTRALTRGEIVKMGDVAIERRPKADFGNEQPAADVVGLAVRRPVRVGQALRVSDVMKPEIVQRNETVTLVYTVPGIVLTMRGKALESGAEGDVVNVLNIQSKRTVQGTVSGPSRVTVASVNTIPRPVTQAETPAPSEPRVVAGR